MMGSRRKTIGAILTVAALALTLVALPASAGEDARPSADPVTGQDHPADIFVVGWHYFPDTLTVSRGQKVKFGNYDVTYVGINAHSLDELVPGCSGPPYTGNNRGKPGCRQPLFSSGLTDHGYVNTIKGLDKTPPGTYEFTCQVHSFMRGKLIVR